MIMLEVCQNLLWIGNALEARNSSALFDLQITAVVDLAYEESPAVLPRGIVYCRFPLNDGGGNSKALLRLTIQTVITLLQSETRALLACSAGMSRSPTVAAFSIGKFLNQSPGEVLKRIGKDKKLEIKETLWKDLTEINRERSS